jgi:uncharacterized peroxidase-related enzyme
LPATTLIEEEPMMTIATPAATQFTVPTRDDLTPAGQELHDGIRAAFGKVPNLYAYMARSANGLGAYLAFQQAQSTGTFSAREQQAVFLVVSEVNQCQYCISAHTVLAANAGFSAEEILELRAGRSDDARLGAIVALAGEITRTRGHAASEVIENFLAEGFDDAAIIDLVMLVADKIVSNYVHNLTGIEIDWPAAAPLA